MGGLMPRTAPGQIARDHNPTTPPPPPPAAPDAIALPPPTPHYTHPPTPHPQGGEKGDAPPLSIPLLPRPTRPTGSAHNPTPPPGPPHSYLDYSSSSLRLPPPGLVPPHPKPPT